MCFEPLLSFYKSERRTLDIWKTFLDLKTSFQLWRGTQSPGKVDAWVISILWQPFPSRGSLWDSTVGWRKKKNQSVFMIKNTPYSVFKWGKPEKGVCLFFFSDLLLKSEGMINIDSCVQSFNGTSSREPSARGGISALSLLCHVRKREPDSGLGRLTLSQGRWWKDVGGADWGPKQGALHCCLWWIPRMSH